MSILYVKYALRFVTLTVSCGTVLLWMAILRPTELQLSESPFTPMLKLTDQTNAVEPNESQHFSPEELSFAPLQRPLFDPPPLPPKEEVIIPLPPLGIKLLGTVINPDRPQAIIADAQGNVKFRSLGQSVCRDHPESAIEEILPSSIKVRRQEQLDTVSVD